MWTRVVESVRSDFSDQEKERGESYFTAGLVTVDSFDRDTASATVRGGRICTVRIATGNKVRMTCSCPFFLDWGENCKHIWAVLLELSQQVMGRVGHKGIQEVSFRNLSHSVEHGGPELQKNNHWKTFFPPGTFNEESAGIFVPRQYYPFFILDKHEISNQGRMTITLDERYFKNNGEWGRQRRFSMERIERFYELDLDSSFRRALSLALIGSQDQGADPFFEEFTIPWGGAKLFLTTLAATRHLFYKYNNYSDGHRLEISKSGDLSFALALASHNENEYYLTLYLESGDTSININDFELFVFDDPCWGIYEKQVYFIKEGAPHQFLKSLRSTSELIIIPKAEVTNFLEVTEARLGGLMTSLQLADGRQLTEITDLHPSPELIILTDDEIRGKLIFKYDEGYRVNSRSLLPYLTDFGKMQRIHRNPDDEAKIKEQLASAGFSHITEASSDFEWCFSNEEADVSDLIEGLILQGWAIFGQDRKTIRTSESFSIAVSTGINWFELDGSIEFAGMKLTLKQLTDLWKKNEKLVKLDDGTLGILPWKWFEQNKIALDSAREEGDSLRFPLTHTGILSSMDDDKKVTFSADHKFATLQRLISDFQGIETAEVSDKFNGTLRDYQQKGLNWLCFLNRFGFGGCLADDMGLGKTIQILALLQHEVDKKMPSLVVVPTSLVYNWMDEAAKFTPELKVFSYTGLNRETMLDNLSDCNLVVTTYGILRREINKIKQINFHYIILDESQAIKNPRTQVAKAAFTLKGQNRITLTGTPVENHIGDLWSQFEFLNPGLLGRYDHFVKQYTVNAANNESLLDPVRKLVKPFILRRMKEDVNLELPPKIEQTIFCDMEDGQQGLYKQVCNSLRSSIIGGTEAGSLPKMKVLSGLLRLRQICCHPNLLSDDLRGGVSFNSGKFTLFQQLLCEVIEEGHKVLVFSQFTSMLAIVKNWMTDEGIKYQYLDGSTRDRGSKIESFQNDESIRVFLISLKAGGLGLNLTAADYIFIYDPWWNPATENQAIDRAHRIGQTKKVITYRMITKSTVEEKIIALQNSKKKLLNSVITTNDNFLKDLTSDDINYLFS